MNEMNKKSRQNDDEISLKEIITILLKEKKIIAIITIVAVALVAIYSFIFLKIEYQNNVLINIAINEKSIETPFGTFENPYDTLDEYIALVKDESVLSMTEKDLEDKYNGIDISRRIQTDSVGKDQSFSIIVKGDNGEDVNVITKVHRDNYLQYLYFDLTYKATDYLYNKNHNEINILERDLKDNKDVIEEINKLLLVTPMTIDSNDGRSGSQEIHPAYSIFLSEIANLDIERISLLNSLDILHKNNEVLSKELKFMDSLKEIPSLEKLNDDILQAIKNIVTVYDEPVNESITIKPNYKFNIAISLVLGLMLGVFAAFFKNYWQNN
ncbi:MAG: hypothetical protein GX947_08420 [Tissierellia bacterium]|nr:hypothetical protein [Tissierellia bacterium]